MSFSWPSFFFRGSGTAAAVDRGSEDAATAAAGGESVVDAAAHGSTTPVGGENKREQQSLSWSPSPLCHDAINKEEAQTKRTRTSSSPHLMALVATQQAAADAVAAAFAMQTATQDEATIGDRDSPYLHALAAAKNSCSRGCGSSSPSVDIIGNDPPSSSHSADIIDRRRSADININYYSSQSSSGQSSSSDNINPCCDH
jgi:hypothetical protein